MQEELNYLELVLKYLKPKVAQINSNVYQQIETINNMHTLRWKLIGGEREDLFGDLHAQENQTLTDIKHYNKLIRSYQKPYFARVDFNHEPIYIGINHIANHDNIYVYDWRSPVASLFYNFDLGTGTYETIDEKITGDITLKRQYRIENSELLSYIDTDININDEYLQDMLVKAKGKEMHSIVDTIQKEQNLIIRNLDDPYLVVQGAAGSGKTIIALHRIAYLMYQLKNLNANNVLILSPNDTFSNYISNVLPELGEENVLQTTFAKLAYNYVGEFSGIENFNEFIERHYLNHKKVEPNITTKFNDDYIKMIDEKINGYISNIKFETGIKMRYKHNKLEIPADEINELFHNKYNKLKLFERIPAVGEYLCNKYLKSEKYDELIIETIYKRIDLEKDFIKFYNLFVNETYTSDDTIRYEDVFPYLYMKFSLMGYPKDMSIMHIVIDEAQDYTTNQLNLLKTIFPKATYTVLGDINQKINPYQNEKTLAFLEKLYGDIKYIELNTVYRSSANITEYANKILGINNVYAIRKDTKPPVLEIEVNHLSEYFKDIKENTTIIVENIQIANKLALDFEKIGLEFEVVEEGMKIDQTNNIIIPAYTAKGLEFEKVIIYNEPNYNLKTEKHLFYIAATRAHHELIIINKKQTI